MYVHAHMFRLHISNVLKLIIIMLVFIAYIDLVFFFIAGSICQ